MLRRFIQWLCFILMLVLAACGPGRLPEQVLVKLASDGETKELLLPQGSTVRDALHNASITLAELDQVRPPETSLLLSGMNITVTRVIQTTEIVTKTKPYPTGQTITDYALKPGESQIIQPGRNGEIATLYRLTYKDGQLVSRVEVSEDETATPVPEIIRKGPSEDFSQIIVPGTLVYMSNNNAYVIRDIVGNKRALTTEGDLDAHVFSLSPDGHWLLYTRGNTSTLNSLWIVDTTLAVPEPQALKIDGVLWANFSPDGKSIAYSHADPSPGLPGWKALNDLTIVPFTNGKLGKGKEIIKASATAPYAWWGTNYTWSPDSKWLAYSNTAEIGLITPTAKITRTLPITNFAAYNTQSTWAWTPALSWSPDGQFLATQLHSPSPSGEADEDSPAFDVAALQISGTLQTPLVVGAGMWAAPRWLGTTAADSQIVYGMAETPYASDTSRYFLYVMDRDGSNRQLLFPAEGQPGIRGLPDFDISPDGHSVIVVYQGDLYWINLNTELTRRLTVDGSISLPRWAK
ncbi:MAG TPA: G5 domain-containing protein [Anaerolineae bacterium]|nr:G5 domain-containing protein [Anaerolineae bacterium]